MIKILKKNIKKKNKIFLKSSLGNIQLFFIDKIFIFPSKIKIFSKNKIIFFETFLGLLSLKFIKNIYFFIKKNKLLINFNLKKCRHQ